VFCTARQVKSHFRRSHCYDRLLVSYCRLSVCPSVTLCIVALRVGCLVVECCTIVFLGRHFLFTSSDTFAVGCIVSHKTHPKTNRQHFRTWITRSTGTSRLLVPPVKQSTIGSRAFPVAGPKTWNSLPEE